MATPIAPVLQQQEDVDITSPSPVRSHVKRQKVTRACDNCKARKRRCTGEVPCSKCIASHAKCSYLASYTRGRLVQPRPCTHAGLATSSPMVQYTQPAAAVRPEIPDHQTNVAESTAKTSRAGSPEGGSTFAGQYLGPQSPYSFLRRAWRRFEEDGTSIDAVSGAAEEPAQSNSIFAYGDRPAPRVDIRTFCLPERSTTAMLLAHYFELAMPTYRFLHRHTVTRWLETFHQSEEKRQPSISPARQAVVLMVLATARFFNVGGNKEILDPDEQSWTESELLYQAAQIRLQRETGRAKLESVQARVASCLYLLHTSRPNYAWYNFGSTTQLIFALGLHRASQTSQHHNQDPITRECRKRVFWAASTLDTYLSVILGKPPLIHLEDVDQKLPDPVDDEDLTASGIGTGHPSRGDSIIKASIFHAQITRIVKKAAREQSSVERRSSSQKLDLAAKLNAETAAWHDSLPVVLSGAIHSSSLIAIFRRQITVLQLAHAHAQMLINRPSLLLDTEQIGVRNGQVHDCLNAAKSTLEIIMAGGFSKNIFQAFWYTQYVAFNALAIVYVWLIQHKHGRLPAVKAPLNENELFRLAKAVQRHLGDASEGNAPSLRYSIVLDELHSEVQRAMNVPSQRPPHSGGLLGAPMANYSVSFDSADAEGINRVLQSVDDGSSHFFTDPFGNDFPLDPDLWLTLDSIPFSDFGQMM